MTRKPPRKAEPGRPLAVIKFKDSTGAKWEFDGALPAPAVNDIMALAVTNGRTTCLRVGLDEGILNAFKDIK